MPKHETPQQKAAEADAIGGLSQWWAALPGIDNRVVLEQTHGGFDDYDFSAYVCGTLSVYGEVKVRKGMTLDNLRNGKGWALDKPKMKAVGEHADRKGIQGMFVVVTQCGSMFYIMLDELRKAYRKGLLSEVPKGTVFRVSATGELDPNKEGWFIPYYLLTPCGVSW